MRELLKKTVSEDNIEYSIFTNLDGRITFRMRDLDANENITLVRCPTMELALTQYNLAVANA